MIQTKLSPLEQEVMVVVWDLKKCHVRDVVNKFGKAKPMAYTTVATLLDRLYKKGMVNKRNEGMAFVFSPKSTSEEYSKKIAKSFLNNFFDSFGESATVSFAKSVESLQKEKREELLRLLGTHESK
ncbi:hypothetical protein A3K29_05940 [Candidatus Collierbacteria bacterium RIFOXYB2_FULL_46_14]|nr:MAG: hypothetical protein A3K29_05940 [Candidatus Collierbacteria bacterium RIFOXYB2_FULL_46_14]OGD76672.1 MAG: hypothetical protein A3K43_05940 [Candidatus Collierbacteria bacterium RIFOXYA2_FULL_46_20]OGD78008.1 MAG: hypothetical protein A3K39_05940 [Candidatus Collierbacteria bacterium RIFOXYC2_FULL_43_15]OGD80032.1 MAG: hypothetical protein A2320_00370 [Pseudomonadales bacterium GWC2_63_15]OGD82730.1 MAG: hypothetical protein A3K36_05940 [Candidatus Collierbacteria bacterium RIFOXYD2_FUL